MTIENKPEGSGSAPEDGVKPASPTDESTNPADTGESQTPTDVEGSSTANDQAEKPSLLDAIEQSMVNESGEPLADKPEVKPQEEGATPADAEAPKPAKAEEKAETDEEKAQKLHEVPEGVKEGSKAHTRFQDLVSNNKQLAIERDSAVSEAQTMRESVAETGINKNEFGALLGYASERKKGDPKKALAFLDAERKNILLELGEDIPAPDILSDFPDLQIKVTDGDLTSEDAVKLAKAKVTEAARVKADEDADLQRQADNEANEQFETNKAKVIALEQGWMKADLDWPAKRELMAPRIAEINKLPPEQWPKAFEDAYKLITDTIEASSLTAKKLTPASPINGGGSDEGGDTEPKTLQEALEKANGWG